MNIKEIKEMVNLMNDNKLLELEIEKEGMRICCPIEDSGLEPSMDGIPLKESAKKLGLHAGPFE